MSISRIEQETVIIFNEEEKTASVYTNNGKLKRKLYGLREQRGDEVQDVSEDSRGGVTFIVPKKWIKVNPSVILTEAQRQERAERARARFSKKYK